MTSADGIPRYAEPTWAELAQSEPTTGTCWNCGHMVEVKLGGKTYSLCVERRDSEGSGDLMECGPDIIECKEWVEA